jgi:Spy/CpxP family protein refolding chaperone
MSRLRAGACLLVTFFVAAGWLQGQDPGAAKAKGRLPLYWSKLKLSDEQRAKVTSVRAGYQAKIDDLKKQIVDLEKREQADLAKILTAEQRAELKKIVASKVAGGGDEPPGQEEKKSGGKAKDKP